MPALRMVVSILAFSLFSISTTTWAVNGTVQTGGAGLHVHSASSLDAGIIGNLDDKVSVSIVCQAQGDAVNGNWGWTTLWDQLSTGGYVTDAFIYTGSNGQVAPTCDPPYASAIEKQNGDVNVFYAGGDPNHMLHMAYWGPSSGVWKDTAVCGGRWTNASPSAVEATFSSSTNTAGTVRIYYNDAGSHTLHECWWNPTNGAWGDWDMGQPIQDSPSAIQDPVSGTVNVYYHGPDKNLHESWLGGDGWHHWAIVANNTGGTRWLAGHPAAILKQDGTVNIFYHDAGDNILHILFRGRGGAWTDVGLGQAITNSPAAVEATIATPTNIAGTVRVYFRSNDSHGTMVEWSWNPINGAWGVYNTGRWTQNNATVVQDRASGNVLVYYNDNGPNPAVLEEYYLDGNGWHANGSGGSAVAGTRWLAGSPTAIAKRNGDVNVFYRDSGDRLLHMAYRGASAGWNDRGFWPMAPKAYAAVPAPTSNPPVGSSGVCTNGNGHYCGGNGVSGDPSTLYFCSGGDVSVSQICASGCQRMAAGTDDQCAGAANPPGGGFSTFRVTAKSYIATIGWNFGAFDWWTPCGLNGANVRLAALAFVTDRAFSENPTNDLLGPPPNNKGYRLFSSAIIQVSYQGTQITNVGGSLTTDTGMECSLPGENGCVQAPPFTVDKPFTVTNVSPSAWSFHWAGGGTPNLLAEPAFQAVCPRLSRYIWHDVSGIINTSSGTPQIRSLVIKGSRFPSHRVWVNNVLNATVPQGPFVDLWEGTPGDPTRVK